MVLRLLLTASKRRSHA